MQIFSGSIQFPAGEQTLTLPLPSEVKEKSRVEKMGFYTVPPVSTMIFASIQAGRTFQLQFERQDTEQELTVFWELHYDTSLIRRETITL